MMKKVSRYVYAILYRSMLILFLVQSAYSQPLCFLCGSDEDGCFDGYEKESCACISVSIQYENQPYCLDLDAMTCNPLSERPACDNHLIFANQANCIATLFQSGPFPPCRQVSQSFCRLHFISMCDENGDLRSCKK